MRHKILSIYNIVVLLINTIVFFTRNYYNRDRVRGKDSFIWSLELNGNNLTKVGPIQLSLVPDTYPL